MISIDSGAFGREDWTRSVSVFDDLSLLQTWEFGEAKAAEGGWRADRLLFRREGSLVGAAQVMVRRLPLVGGGLAWLNRGPLWRKTGEADGDPAPLMAALRRHYRGYYLRVAPASPDFAAGPGFRSTGRAGWASAVVDLTPPVEELRARLVGKWRNHLAKAERAGLEVSGGTGADFDAFLDAHGRFLTERAIPTTVTAAMLGRLYHLAPDDAKPAAFVARQDGAVVGGLLMVRYGRTCEYLAGNGTEAGRRLNSGHLLLWRAMAEMRAAGCRVCDLSGLDPLRTPPGIVEFKSGLKGVPYRLAEEVEACSASPLARLVRWRVCRALNQVDAA